MELKRSKKQKALYQKVTKKKKTKNERKIGYNWFTFCKLWDSQVVIGMGSPYASNLVNKIC